MSFHILAVPDFVQQLVPRQPTYLARNWTPGISGICQGLRPFFVTAMLEHVQPLPCHEETFRVQYITNSIRIRAGGAFGTISVRARQKRRSFRERFRSGLCYRLCTLFPGSRYAPTVTDWCPPPGYASSSAGWLSAIFLCLLRAGVRGNEPPSHCWSTTFTSRGERRTLAHRPYYSLSDGQCHCRAEPCVSFDPGYVGRHRGSRILPAPWFKRHSTRAINITPTSFLSKRRKASRELWNVRMQGSCWP